MSSQHMMSKNSLGTAVVTGASSGIGAVYADRLAKRGYDLILVARRADRLAEISQRLQQTYAVSVETIIADLADHDDLEKVTQVLDSDTKISLLVNNAGTATLAPITQTDVAAQNAMIALNVTALTRLSIAALDQFVARDRGAIINIGSVLSFHTLPVSGVYSGTKGYVMNFTRGLQAAVSGKNVKVQLVMPAVTRTEIWGADERALDIFDPKVVMSAESLVDAALAGLDQGEEFTLPSIEDASLWSAYEAARSSMYAASGVGKPASRYAA